MEPPPERPSRRSLLSWTLRALRGLGRPLDRLGQHFLVDPAVIRGFVEELRPYRGLDALEVGVGLGTLTYYVAPQLARVVGVDVDERMAIHTASIAPPNTLIAVEDGLSAAGASRAPVVYSNTPYNISAHLIAAIARNNSVTAAVLMVQKEVAERATAEPGGGEYGRLSVLTSRFFHARVAGRFGRRSFHPPPRVDSALLVLRRRKPWVPGLDDAVEELARCLFSQRNKLALKVVEACVGSRLPGELRERLAGRRVRDLTHTDLEEVVRATGYSPRLGGGS